jgi:hypothetical protein
MDLMDIVFTKGVLDLWYIEKLPGTFVPLRDLKIEDYL